MTRPRFDSETDFLAWVIAKIGQILGGYAKWPDEDVQPGDAPILEAFRARRVSQILAERIARGCDNPSHQRDEAEPGDVAEALREAEAHAAAEIPITYRKEQ